MSGWQFGIFRVLGLSATDNAPAGKSRIVNHVIMDPGHRDGRRALMQQGTIEEDMRVMYMTLALLVG